MAHGLTITMGENFSALADELADLLREDPPGVFEETWVVVPSAGVRQWFDWLMAERMNGIASGFRHFFPEEFERFVTSFALNDDASAVPATTSVLALALCDELGDFSRARLLAQDVDELIRWRADFVDRPHDAPPGATSALAARAHLAERGIDPLGRYRSALARLRSSQPLEVPRRVVCFGLTTIPGGPHFAELLSALSTRTEVSVWSCGLRHDQDAPLNSFSQETDDVVAIWNSLDAEVRWLERTASLRTTLDSLKGALNGDEVATTLDRTVHFVGCVGLSRQVEVARDLILEAIAEGFSPHEIVVYSPNPAELDALLERHWHHDPGQGPRLAYQLTETSLQGGSRRVDLVAAIMATSVGYGARDEVRSLIGDLSRIEVLAAPDAVSSLDSLIERAPVSFGVSSRHRDRLALTRPGDERGTWRNMVDRVALTSIFDPNDPVDQLGTSGDLAAVASISPLLDALEFFADRSHQSRRVGEWTTLVEEGFVWCPSSLDDNSLEHALSRLRTWTSVADPEVNFTDFRRIFNEASSAHVRQRTFGARGVTVTSPTTMPGAPYRLAVFVGFDEDRLPQATLASSVLHERRPGDPEARRSLISGFAHCVLASTERVVVTFSHRHESNGRPLDRAVPLDELIDAVARSVSLIPSEFVVTTSRHAFVAHVAPGAAGPRTFDANVASIEVGAGRLLSPAAALRSRTRATPDPFVPLEDVRRFWANPLRAFLERGLDAGTPKDADDPFFVPPITIDALTKYQLRERYVRELTDLLSVAIKNGTDLELPDEPHVAGDECEHRSCGTVHADARLARQRVLDSLGAHRIVDERLWVRSLDYTILDLASVNLALDLSTLHPLALDQELDVPLGERCSDPVGWLGSLNAQRERDDVRMVRFDARDRDDHRNLLVDAFDVATLHAFGVARASVDRYFLPSRAAPYLSRAQGTVPKGGFQLNPLTRLDFLGTQDDALRAVAIMTEIAQRGLSEPLPLFRRTSVMMVATGLWSDAQHRMFTSTHRFPDLWSSQYAYRGEREEPAHRLLFPMEFSELVELIEQHYSDLLDEIRTVLSWFTITSSSGTTRRPPEALLHGPNGDLWAERIDKTRSAVAVVMP